jgi:hypothetical protein
MAALNVKKVKPYPIPAQFILNGAAFPGDIVKLVLKGFMVDTRGKVLTVGSVLQVTFELPVLRATVTQNVKVVKTFDRANPKTHAIDRIAECHFTVLSDQQETHIYEFLQAIRQDDMG